MERDSSVVCVGCVHAWYQVNETCTYLKKNDNHRRKTTQLGGRVYVWYMLVPKGIQFRIISDAFGVLKFEGCQEVKV